jgi:cytochrome oxidase Cu insertion factor (SCO1/SenC/PrrC family)
MRLREAGALGALAVILGLTAALWALALWPLPTDAPLWLARTRAVCFGSTSSGMPDVSGWLVMIVQPGIMLSILFTGWGAALADGLRWWARGPAGRASLLAVAAGLALGLGAAGWRVAGASDRPWATAPDDEPPASYPRLDRPAPPLDLVDQHGAVVSPSRFAGRPVLVTFAYAHCVTVCPVIVHDVLSARRTASTPAPVVVIVTLDPERDVPARLPAIAAQWKLGVDELVVSGSVAAVEAALDRWNVARARDPRPATSPTRG